MRKSLSIVTGDLIAQGAVAFGTVTTDKISATDAYQRECLQIFARGRTFATFLASPFLSIAGSLQISPSSGLTVTTFATGLDFPTSMTSLADGSLLVGTTTPPANTSAEFAYYFGSSELVRLASSSNNGVADSSTVVASGLPGAVTSVRQIGPLIAVATVGNGSVSGLSQGDITFLKPGANPTDPYTNVGSIHLQAPLTSLALGVSQGAGGSYSLYFGIGADNTGTPVGSLSLSGLEDRRRTSPPVRIYQLTVNTNAATHRR